MTESAAKEVTLFCENANNRFLNVPRLRLAYEAALARFVLQICFNHGKFCRIIAIISTAGSVLSHIEVEVHSSFDIQAVLKAEVEPDGQLISYGDQQSITVTHVFPIDQTFYVEYVGSATGFNDSGLGEYVVKPPAQQPASASEPVVQPRTRKTTGWI